MNSSESLKKVGLVGAVAVIACLGLQDCKDKKVSGPSFESGDFEKEVKTVRRGLRRGFEDLIDEESDEEYTVQVDLDENGEIPENFNYVAAIRDCVESTGKYRCFDAVWGSETTCYNQNAQGGMVPVSISNMFLVLEDFKGKEEFVRVDAGNAINLMSTQVDKKDVSAFQGDLNTACRTAIDGLETQYDEEEIDEARHSDNYHEYVQTQASFYPQLSEDSDELFDTLKESDFEVEDKGGNIFTIDFGNGSKGTIHARFANKTQMVDEDPEYGVVYSFLGSFETPDYSFARAGEFHDMDEAINFVFESEEEANQ